MNQLYVKQQKMLVKQQNQSLIILSTRMHVIPVNDLREHEASADCWCRPTPDEEHDIFVHHSLDGREAYETGEKRPS